MSFIWSLKKIIEASAPGENFVALLSLMIPVLAIIYVLFRRRWSALKPVAVLCGVIAIVSVVIFFFDIQLPYHKETSGWFWSNSQNSTLFLLIGAGAAMLFSTIALATVELVHNLLAERRRK